MIINTVINSGGNRQNIELITPQIFLIKNEGEVVELSFTYTNQLNLSGYALLYLNGIVVASRSVDHNETVEIDIESYLDETGFFTFKLIVIDEDKSVDSLEFKVLYNYQNINDFSFTYNSLKNAYILSAYNGSSSSLLIPPVFNGEQGILTVYRIENGVFLDNNSLVSVEIPLTITEIGVNAFYSASSLNSVTLYSIIPPILGGDNVFDPYVLTSILRIYVPASSLNAYKTANF